MIITDQVRISEDEFVDRFQPMANWLNDDAGFSFGAGGCLFETFGAELAAVKAADAACVWTIIDGDGSATLASGFHVVNRIGYLICKVPVPTRIAYLVEP